MALMVMVCGHHGLWPSGYMPKIVAVVVVFVRVNSAVQNCAKVNLVHLSEICTRIWLVKIWWNAQEILGNCYECCGITTGCRDRTEACGVAVFDGVYYCMRNQRDACGKIGAVDDETAVIWKMLHKINFIWLLTCSGVVQYKGSVGKGRDGNSLSSM